jgi:3-keto-5-aminohexanoate cleavage enzyme
MDPLIITATPNVSWLHPDVWYPKSAAEIADQAAACVEAGASIVHVHAEGKWREAIRSVRKRTTGILQCGMSSLPIPERMGVFKEGADMISIMLSHHDEAFVGLDTHRLHPREELVEYMKLASRYRVKPEFEVWHSGSIWNLRFLVAKNTIAQPYFATLFLGWPGGNWSPPTVEEYIYRRKLMPKKGVVSVSVMDRSQAEVLTEAITRGDHVRVGTEDNPFIGEKLATTPELVKWISGVSKARGRPVASVKEAARLIGVAR